MRYKLILKISFRLALAYTCFLFSFTCINLAQKGREVVLLNQTKDGICIFTDNRLYTANTLPKAKKAKRFSTIINDSVLIIRNELPYIHSYSESVVSFFSEYEIKDYQAMGIDSIIYYFIKEKDIDIPIQTLKDENKIKKYQLAIKDMKMNTFDTSARNLIYFFPDSIVFKHQYY